MISRIFELEEEVRKTISENNEQLRSKDQYYTQKLDDAYFENEKQKDAFENLEAIIEDVKKQYEVTKNLYTCELNQKTKNQERSSEIIEKYRQVIKLL